jgi:hypothetical protein
LKSFLVGDISLDDWNRETHDFSSVLINSGRELGRILVTAGLPPQERIQEYMKELLGTQATLSAKWTASIGSDSKI